MCVSEHARQFVVIEVLQHVARVDRVHGASRERHRAPDVEPMSGCRQIDVDVDELRVG